MPVFPRGSYEPNKNVQYLARSASGKAFDPTKEANPDTVDNNGSRNGFRYNPRANIKGVKFQITVKQGILKLLTRFSNKLGQYTPGTSYFPLYEALITSIKIRVTHEEERERKQLFLSQAAKTLVYYAEFPEKLEKDMKNPAYRTALSFVWNGMKAYDKNAFIYDDERLDTISRVLKVENELFWNSNNTFDKIIDILIFLMKEDIYYRPRFIQILQDVRPTVRAVFDKENHVLVTLNAVCWVASGMELTPVEIQNIERWH